jgi:trehalose 6-phosphate synthase
MTQNAEATEGEHRYATAEVINDLVVISNRQPYRHEYADDSVEITVDEPAGGLAIGLNPVMQRIDGTWIAWGDGKADFDIADEDNQVKVPPSDPSYTLQRVNLSESEVRGYYDGYANQALWPLFHSATDKMNFDTEEWEQYQAVNERFAETIGEHIDDGTTIWFQDYHFTLAPRIVRENNPEVFQMHFFHIPWPAPEVFRLCPQAETLLRGLLGNDLLQFHCSRYSAQFLTCVDQLLEGAVVDWSTGTVTFEGRDTRIETIPFGIDADDIESMATDADTIFWLRFCTEHDIDTDTTIALGVDRLDYTKGIPERLEAIERLFETRPDLRGELTYVQKGSPTRERIPAYQELREEIEDSIRSLNDRFGTDDWSPVVYTTTMFDREELCSLYRYSDVAVVGPLRDGMNLVAKEYVASQVDNDGVLLLSPFAGADEELGHAAVEFDPYDTESAAEAIVRSFEMDSGERRERIQKLRSKVHETDLSWWLEEIVDTATEVQKARAYNNGRNR